MRAENSPPLMTVESLAGEAKPALPQPSQPSSRPLFSCNDYDDVAGISRTSSHHLLSPPQNYTGTAIIFIAQVSRHRLLDKLLDALYRLNDGDNSLLLLLTCRLSR